MMKTNLKDVTDQLIRETEEFLQRLDDYEPAESSIKQIMDSYEESKEQYC